jgi:hypothetical protein
MSDVTPIEGRGLKIWREDATGVHSNPVHPISTAGAYYAQALAESCRPRNRDILRGSVVTCRKAPRFRAHIERLPVVSCTAGFKLCVFDAQMRDQSIPLREQVCAAEWEAWHELMQFEFSEDPFAEAAR